MQQVRHQPQHAASSVVETASEPRAEASNAGSLRLRGHHAERTKDDKGVKWVEGTVDNEGLGRKKSKICCIYHKPRPFDESSDESSSDEEHAGGDTAQPSSGSRSKGKGKPHSHQHADGCSGGSSSGGSSGQLNKLDGGGTRS